MKELSFVRYLYSLLKLEKNRLIYSDKEVQTFGNTKDVWIWRGDDHE